jgi:DMSO/TMAO reductase YedYZ heme-binding membrane subunit
LDAPGPLGWSRSAWRLVGLWFALLVVLSITILVGEGLTDASLGRLARVLQRLAFGAFIIAFVARPLRTWCPGAWTARLCRYRPQIGVSFVLAHWMFVLTNVVRVPLFHDGDFLAFRSIVTWAGGGAAEALFAAMVVTSFPRPRRMLGETWWRRLHTFGVHVAAIIFGLSFASRVPLAPWYAVPVAILAGAYALRVAEHCVRWCGSRADGARDAPGPTRRWSGILRP